MARLAEKVAQRPIIIIGAGIQGCATAFFLSQRKKRVIVLDKDNIARHASGVNAGGVRRLGRNLAELPLSITAMDWWNKIDKLLCIKNGFNRQFYVKVALDDYGVTLATKRISELNAAGFEHENWIDKESLRRRIPAITKIAKGGLIVEGDGWAIPWKITLGFYDRARALGAKFLAPVKINRIERYCDHWQLKTDFGTVETDCIVNCAGAWGGRIAKMVGDNLPIEAHAPMLAVTDQQPMFLNSVIGVMGATLSLKQLQNGTIIIGGGIRGKALPEKNESHLTPAGLGKFIRTAGEVFPHLKDAQVMRAWAGIEGYTPDHLPIIGRGSQSGIFHGFGFSAHGFQLGPGVGEALADLVMQRQPRVSLAAFKPSRFENDLI